MQGVTYSPTDPEVLADPFGHYAALRRGSAAQYLESDDLWVVSRYEHVDAALRSPGTLSSKALWALFGGVVSARPGERPDVRALAAAQPRSLIAMDPPDHVPLRRLAAPMFTKKAVDGYAGLIRRICEELTDELLERREDGEVDLVEAFHHPLPVRVIADILGIPAERKAEFKVWSDILIKRLSSEGHTEPEQIELKRMMEYFGEIIRERTRSPGDDLISLIIQGNRELPVPLTEWDLFNFCSLLLSAGNETTTNLLGNLFNAFFDHPDQHAKAREVADVTPVVEEILRYESTVQGLVRLANPGAVIGDVELPPDAMVLLLTGSANRDEARWPDGDKFDIERRRLPHLGFGTGIHHCLGAALARLETAIAWEVLRRRTATIERTAPGTRACNIILRGFSALPVRVRAA
jgi:cytochrome P450